MKEQIKKYSVLISIALIIVVISSIYISVNRAKKVPVAQLHTIEGDVNVLDDVIISFNLEDWFHTQKLTFTNGKIKQKYIQNNIYKPDEAIEFIGVKQFYVPSPTAKKVLQKETLDDGRVELTQEVSEVQTGVALTNYADRGGVQNKIHIHTDLVSLKGESNVFTKQQTYHENGNIASDQPFRGLEVDIQEMGLTSQDVEGNIYFTPQIDENTVGITSIYRTKKWVDYYDDIFERMERYYYERPYGEVEELTQIPLEGKNIQTLNLSCVNNKLYLLLSIDGTLTLKTYTLQGELIHESELGPCEEINPQARTFVNNSNDETIISFALYNVTHYEEEYEGEKYKRHTEELNRVIAINADDNDSLQSIVYTNNAAQIACINRQWFILYIKENNLFIEVYNTEGETIYIGEVLLDSAQDIIHRLYARNETLGTRYQQPYTENSIEWRHITDMVITQK